MPALFFFFLGGWVAVCVWVWVWGVGAAAAGRWGLL